MAFIASLSLVLMGLVGVATASPAAADVDPTPQASCEAAGGTWSIDKKGDGSCKGAGNYDYCEANPSANGCGHFPITICHRTASTTNPYVVITVDANSIKDMKDFNAEDPDKGHSGHNGPVFDPAVNTPGNGNVKWGDIIPKFDWQYRDKAGNVTSGSFPGQNATEGAAYLENNCQQPGKKFSAEFTCESGLSADFAGYEEEEDLSVTFTIDGDSTTKEMDDGELSYGPTGAPGPGVHSASIALSGEGFGPDVIFESEIDCGGLTAEATSVCSPGEFGSWTITWTVANSTDEVLNVVPTGAGSFDPTARDIDGDDSGTFVQTVTNNGDQDVTFTGTAGEGEGAFTVTVTESYSPSQDCSAPTSSMSCTAWAVDITYWPAAPAPKPEEGVTEDNEKAVALVPVTVLIDGKVVAEGFLDKDGAYSASGTNSFADDKTHTLTVKVDGKVVDSLTKTSAVCPSPPPNPQCTTNCNPTTDTPQTPETPVEPAVVEQAVTVDAAEPAVVTAPAPAKVNVPAAATLPASVPAGDGSQNPGLPLWALAMLAVGIIGAAATGKQLLGARK